MLTPACFIGSPTVADPAPVPASPLPACLLIVIAEIDAACEDEWNRWYDEVHLPDALACPGVLCGRRYRSASRLSLTERGAKTLSYTVAYAAVYALSGPEAIETPEFKAMAGWYQFTDRIKARTQIFQAL
jgi:hypothetical protein